MPDNTPKPWQAGLILVGMALFNRKFLRPDKLIKLIIAAVRTAWTIHIGQALIVGDVEKQYGPFRLHAFTLQRKDGSMRQEPFLVVVVGMLPTPVVIPLSHSSQQVFDAIPDVVVLVGLTQLRHMLWWDGSSGLLELLHLVGLRKS